MKYHNSLADELGHTDRLHRQPKGRNEINYLKAAGKARIATLITNGCVIGAAEKRFINYRQTVSNGSMDELVKLRDAKILRVIYQVASKGDTAFRLKRANVT